MVTEKFRSALTSKATRTKAGIARLGLQTAWPAPSGEVPSEVGQTLSLSQIQHDVSARTFAMAWSPSNASLNQLVTGGEDHVVLWSAGGAGLPQHRLKFALPSSKKVSSSSQAPSWVTAGHSHGHSHGQLPPACMQCAWHPDGREFLTGSDDGQVAVWSAQDGSCLLSFSASERTIENQSEVYGLSVLSKEFLVAVACLDTVQQWDLLTGQQTAHLQLESHGAGLTFGGNRNPSGLAYVFGMASRGRVIAATLSDGTCRLIDAQTCKEHAVLEGHVLRGTSAVACALSPTSTLLATTGGDGAVLLWDLRSLRSRPLAEVCGHTQAVHGVCFADAGALGAAAIAGELLVTGSSDGTVRVAEMHTVSGGQASCIASMHLGGPVLCTAFNSSFADPGTERIGVGVGSGRDATDNTLCFLSVVKQEEARAEAEAKPAMAQAEAEAKPAVAEAEVKPAVAEADARDAEARAAELAVAGAEADATPAVAETEVHTGQANANVESRPPWVRNGRPKPTGVMVSGGVASFELCGACDETSEEPH